ncbi:hypothetical protein Glove_26g199 [Diversispora epigaea]|uniref:Uncharacterized protein n=1 Tax=Diversispora epigaea TaxID=1348612 RepID=A0A397JLF4_9GLOM|nr:hypothetical protein Glove_26g199 [Diversispora epigaea]
MKYRFVVYIQEYKQSYENCEQVNIEETTSTKKENWKNLFFLNNKEQMIWSYKKAKKSKSPFWNKNVGDIYTKKISENARNIKKKKKLTAIEKVILHYSTLNIIDLSTHMKSWFCIDDKKFIVKNYKSILRIPELAVKEKSFILKIENEKWIRHINTV